MIIQGKNYHKSLFVNSVNSITGNTYSAISNYQQYFQLREDNLLLAEENTRLKALTPIAVRKLNDRYIVIDDSLYQQKYTYRRANVVRNSISKRNNYVVINLGAKDGVMEDMGIITDNGIVGMVVQVSDHYAKAISFLHQNTNIACKIKRNNASGTLVWQEGNHRMARLENLPLTTNVLKGDTVMTNGFSFIYPKGILMGEVASVDKNQETQQLDIRVKLSLDYNSLNHVYVVENLDKKELETINQEEL